MHKPKSVLIKAKFNGVCRTCQTRVRAGEQVEYTTGITSCPVCLEFPEGGVAVEVCVQVALVKVQSDRSNWGVIKARVTEVISTDCTDAQLHLLAPGKLYSVAGPVGMPVEGEEAIVRGRLVLDERWGLQIKLEAPLESRGITTLTALGTYLDMAPNIGPARTREILKLAKHDLAGVYRLLGDEWERLITIKGITRESAERIHTWYESTLASRSGIQFLGGLELQQGIQRRVLNAWKMDTERRVRANPFDLMQFDGVGFRTADDVASRIGFDRGDPRRVAAAVLHILQSASEDGHTFLPLSIINGTTRAQRFSSTERAVNDVGLSSGELVNALEKAIELSPVPIHVEDGNVSIARFTLAEQTVADVINKIARADVPALALPSDVSALFGGLTPAPEQSNACRVIADRSIVVLTGGPGVGKTQTTRALIQLFHDNKLTVFSVAPTGRAALRLAELTGHPAATIHRQIAIKPGLESEEFKLGCDVVICDEASMIDVELAANLLRAVDTGRPMRIVFVGDVDQLPPVGPGDVFRNLIDSGCVPVVRLTKIFRQAADSPIPHLAQAINAARLPTFEKSDGFAFIDVTKPDTDAEQLAELAAETIVLAATKWLIEKKRGGAESIADIAVVTPQRTGACGVRSLNERIAAIVNADKPIDAALKYGDGYYHVGDKVMQTQNDYELNVFNGEIGLVAYIDESGDAASQFTQATSYEVSSVEPKTHLVAEYAAPGMPGNKRFVAYSRSGLNKVTLAYAMTTHKMQGSSAKCVIFAATSQHRWMLSRRLIYTTVTRAENYLLIVGEIAALRRAITAASNDTPRNTRLEALLTPKAVTATDWFNGLDI